MRKLLLMIPIMLLSILLYGCNDNKIPTEISKEQAQQLMKERLDNKYKTEFTVDSPIVFGDEPYAEAKWMESNAFKIGEEEKQFKVKIDFANPTTIVDNYEAYVFNDTVNEMFQEKVDKFWNNSKVSVMLQAEPECDNENMREDAIDYLYVEEPRALSRIYIGVDTYNNEEEIEKVIKFVKELYEHDMYGEMHMVYLDKSTMDSSIEQLSTIPDSSLEGNSLIKKHAFIYMKPSLLPKDKEIKKAYNK